MSCTTFAPGSEPQSSSTYQVLVARSGEHVAHWRDMYVAARVSPSACTTLAVAQGGRSSSSQHHAPSTAMYASHFPLLKIFDKYSQCAACSASTSTRLERGFIRTCFPITRPIFIVLPMANASACTTVCPSCPRLSGPFCYRTVGSPVESCCCALQRHFHLVSSRSFLIVHPIP